MSAVFKLWAAALLACAIGTTAQARDSERELAKQQACLKVIYNNYVCNMHNAATEELALEFRRSAEWGCAQTVTGDGTPTDKAECTESRAYILGRWGY
jgi:hypothetical protein